MGTTSVKESVTKLQRSIPDWWDVPVLIVIFAGLLVLGLGYAPSARQFPVTFLAAGLFFLTFELLSEILPGKYGRTLKNLSEGMASDFEMEMDEELKAQDDSDDAADENRSWVRDNRAKVLVMALNVVVMFVVSYLVGFLLAIPIFAAVSVYTVGSGKVTHFLVITVILMASVYFLFGEIMNVPILEGVWLDL